jgi:hypothetical protein
VSSTYLVTVFLHSPCTTRQTTSNHSYSNPTYLTPHKGMSPSRRHTQGITSDHGIQLCRRSTSGLDFLHHPQPEIIYLLQARKKAPLSSAFTPSSPISAIYLVPLYLLLLLRSIQSAVLINYLITLESCNTLVK